MAGEHNPRAEKIARCPEVLSLSGRCGCVKDAKTTNSAYGTAYAPMRAHLCTPAPCQMSEIRSKRCNSRVTFAPKTACFHVVCNKYFTLACLHMHALPRDLSRPFFAIAAAGVTAYRAKNAQQVGVH